MVKINKKQKDNKQKNALLKKMKMKMTNMMNRCAIIVARYNENIEWTKQLHNVRIYNKGTPLLENEPTVIALPNVGREGHTYYSHLVENYDNLPDYTIFLQGNPFDHSPHILANIHTYLVHMQEPNFDMDFAFLSENILECSLQECIFHPNLPLMDVYKHLFADDMYTHNVDVDPAFRFRFGAGAQFIVSKKIIHQRPKEFYKKIVELLEHDINPIEGFVIERFHKLIFS